MEGSSSRNAASSHSGQTQRLNPQDNLGVPSTQRQRHSEHVQIRPSFSNSSGLSTTEASLKAKSSSVAVREMNALIPSAERPKKRRKVRAISIWAPECLLILASTAILASIVVILHVYQTQPQPSWRLGINLTTIIALLATLLRNSITMVVEESKFILRVTLLHSSQQTASLTQL